MGDMELRSYQQNAITATLNWFRKNEGNPCIEAPTGAGKSWIIAGFCKFIMTRYPESRLLILSHVKELLQQDAEKILTVWPEAPLGIYSAGLGTKMINDITVAGIQSVRNKAAELGKISAVFVDEAHLINNTEVGSYRKLLSELRMRSPKMRVIGLTATPYRLGQGLLTEGDNALFDAIIPSVSVDDLVKAGYLAPLRSKFTAMHQNTDGVKTRMGDFVESELQAAVDTDAQNAAIVDETIARAGDRRAWLVFACGVNHALHLRDIFRERGISAETVTGDTPKDERAEILSRFKAGEIRCITNANVLTTGFDHPGIDVIVMARPTQSTGLYVQMAGRGMRTADNKEDCLVLDFAGNVKRHGPITSVQPNDRKKSKGAGTAPTKHCPDCDEILAASARVCTQCGHIFEQKPPELVRHNDDIMGDSVYMRVGRWRWSLQYSKNGGIPMIRVNFYDADDIGAYPVPLYLCLMHDGYAGSKAAENFESLTAGMVYESRYEYAPPYEIGDLEDIIKFIKDEDKIQPPDWIKYRIDGKFKKVIEWGSGDMPC